MPQKISVLTRRELPPSPRRPVGTEVTACVYDLSKRVSDSAPGCVDDRHVFIPFVCSVTLVLAKIVNTNGLSVRSLPDT